MNKKTKGIVAGVAGGVLLLGAGGTFALWSDSERVPGGMITAGTLDIQTKPLEWFDVSPDRIDRDNDLGITGLSWDNFSYQFQDQDVIHAVPAAPGGQVSTRTDFRSLTGEISGNLPDNPGQWRVVPGDFVLGSSHVTIQGHGDNLNYVLRVQSVDEQGQPVPIASGDLEFARSLGLHVMVFEEDQQGNLQVVTGPERIVGNSGTAQDELTVDLDLGRIPSDGATELEERKFRVALVGNFPENVDEQHLMSIAGGTDVRTVLDRLTVTVEQVRPAVQH